MAERSSAVLTAALAILLLASLARQPAAGRAEPAPEPSAGTTLLLLPSLHTGEGPERSPWSAETGRRDAARFERFEAALAARLGEAGYRVLTTADALGKPGVRDALAEAAAPLAPAAAAGAARAAGAEVALVFRAEVVRSGGAATSGSATSDALVDADAYRAADGLRLASATKRATGLGADAMEADAEALVRAAAPLVQAIEGPLANGVARPVVAARPIRIVLEGRLDWRAYQQTIAILREALPEIGSLEERRFARGRFTLEAMCGCESEEAARRLDGLSRGGLRLEAALEGEGLRVRVARVEAAETGAPPVSFGAGEPDPETPP